jgi:chloride channel protein, CIC family
LVPSPDPRRITYLTALAASLGLLAGVAAWLLIRMIAFLTNLTLFGRIGFTLPAMSTLQVSPRIVVVAVLGALVVAALAIWSPIIKGHGIPEAMESVLVNQSRVSPRAAVAKPLSAAIAIGTGGPFGAEGPIIVTGGSLGSLLGQMLDVSPSERKILLACGAAGGMAATFGAPLASIVLAIELLLFEFSTRSLIPLAVSAAVASAVHAAIFGSGPLFSVPAQGFAGLADLPLFVPLGIISGLAAFLIAKGLFVVEAGFRRIPVAEFWHPAIGAVGFALVGMMVPNVLGVGYDVIDMVLADQLAVGALAVLAVAKLVAWWLALGSGTSGGTLAPILLIAGSLGGLIGHATLALVPDSNLNPGAFALVAMAAVFGAATRATLTSIVFVFELTQSYESILPIILAAVLADLVAVWLLPNTIMTEKLARRGLLVSTDMATDILTSYRVREVMSRSVMTLDVGSSLELAIAKIDESGHSALPLVDNDVVVGIVSRSDLLDDDSERLALALAKRDVVTVGPDDNLRTALTQMIKESVEHLPVVDSQQRLKGICTRTDILRAQAAISDADQTQPGWRHLVRRTRST